MAESMVELSNRISRVPRFQFHGRVTRVVGLVVEAVGVEGAVGDLCRIHSGARGESVAAEIVGFQGDHVLLMPLGSMEGVKPGAAVQRQSRSSGVPFGAGLLGRVLDGLGRPMDGLGPIAYTRMVPIAAEPPNPLTRRPIRDILATGVRSLDGFLTLGRGQRMGIFAGSGVGKSTLLGMMARRTSADVNVIALLGERGREVRDFIEGSLGPEGLARSVVVVATGDQPALVRARGALVATALAEAFRDEGKEVLLMVDSVTRVAMAWRELGLAVGEPPTTRGYPPSVFAQLPRLLERAGNGSRGGITGIYTVLVEGDDFNEPVADHVRSVVDGHVVLSRKLASAGHYPAVDVLESTSRVRDQIVDPEVIRASNRLLELLAAFREKEDLIAVGAYEPGNDALLDRAVRFRDPLKQLLRQEVDDPGDVDDVFRRIVELDRAASGEGR
ncbi:MAG: FliI/YscN family ATPase [Gemmatimonadales bacterium]|nr:MAG: FliI/YscN family ATPase [Gemmatimonadales bacterium]